MSEKIPVKICTGTLCYVMGGSELQLLEEYLPEDLLGRVDIKGSPCLNCCDRRESSHAPYVQVGEELIPRATLQSVIAVIRTQINKDC